MSCDFDGRDELRAALISSTTLLQAAFVLARGPEERVILSEQVERNKKALKAEAVTRPPLVNPETCPTSDTL